MLTSRSLRRRRAGFTLAELLVVMVTLGVVGMGIVMMMVRQQRLFAGVSEIVETRQQLRQGVAMLPADLRGVSSVGGDIYATPIAMTDSSMEFRSTTGSSVVCVFAGGKLSTVPERLARGSGLTTWTAVPTVGDSVAVYNTGTTATEATDKWTFHEVSAVASINGNLSSGCPTSSGLVQAADVLGNNPSYQLTFKSPTPTTAVDVGAAMRFFRRVHYSIYKAADNKWYVGYYDCKPLRVPVCNPIQPIAGPFNARTTDATSGLQFTYYDETGAVTTDRLAVARVSIVIRGRGQRDVNLTGMKGAVVFNDSLRIAVALRNRK